MTDTATSFHIAAHEPLDGIALHYDGRCAVLTLSNPERRNAFYPEMRRRLADQLQVVHNDPAVLAVVITGEGEHFCTGADMKRTAARPAKMTALDLRENLTDVHRLLRQIVDGAKPVIAAVEGDAYGAGCAIAMASDVVVATNASRFGIAYTRLGLFPEMGLLYTLAQRVGGSKAKSLLLASAVVGGDEANAIGMADVLAEQGGALAAALELAKTYESCAPLSMALIKGAVAGGIDTIEDAMRAELSLMPVVSGTDDSREGMAALREKRPPRFTGQ